MTTERFNRLNKVDTTPKLINLTPIWIGLFICAFFIGLCIYGMYTEHQQKIVNTKTK